MANGGGMEDKAAWRVRFGFWDELDVLYSSFPPPSRPRQPSQPRDSPVEWCASSGGEEPRRCVSLVLLLQGQAHCAAGVERVARESVGGRVPPRHLEPRDGGDQLPHQREPLRRSVADEWLQPDPLLLLTRVQGGPCTGKQSLASLLKQQIQRLEPDRPCRFTVLDASKTECVRSDSWFAAQTPSWCSH